MAADLEAPPEAEVEGREEGRSCASSGSDSRKPPSAALPRGTRVGPAPGRTGSATPPRAAMPAPSPGCGTPAPGCGNGVRHRPLSGVHPMPLSTSEDDGLHRGAHHSGAPPPRCAAPSGDVRHSRAPVRRTRCPAAHRCAHRRSPPPSGPAGGAQPLVQLRYTPLSSTATATFPLDIAGFGLRSGRGQGGV